MIGEDDYFLNSAVCLVLNIASTCESNDEKVTLQGTFVRIWLSFAFLPFKVSAKSAS